MLESDVNTMGRFFWCRIAKLIHEDTQYFTDGFSI